MNNIRIYLYSSHADSKVLGDVHAMVSRALLLLRSATAVVQSAFNDAHFDVAAADLRSWFDTVGPARGFWSPDDPPDQYDDLWHEVSFAVKDLDQRGAMSFSRPA